MGRLQVFATDLNEALLDKARHGLYAKSVAQDLSPDRLRRFFIEEEGGYRVNKALREMVVFARQNVISDPPFSRLDLISCRNLLIYFEPELQRTVFPAFHYALKPGGFLCLGASESIGSFTELFEPIDKKHKIYARKSGAPVAFQLPLKKAGGDVRANAARAERGARVPASQGDLVDPARHELTAQREADRVIANQFAPPAVLINADLQILQFRGPTGAYLEPPTGKATLDVLKMVRSGLMLPLRAAITQAKKDNKTVRKDSVKVEHDGAIRTVSLQVIPLTNLRERSFLVVFDEGALTTKAAHRRRGGKSIDAKAGRTGRADQSRRIGELEAELAEMRDYQQGLQEQHEAANEELQASNEEVQSANEELQSINEELETSKEELQSANEELTTVNDEMVTRNTALNRLNSDLKRKELSIAAARDYAQAIIRTAPDPLLILHADLRVDTANQAFYDTFKVSPTDAEGRLVYELGNHQWDIPRLRELLEDILPRNRAFDRFEVTHAFSTIGRRTMLLNARRLNGSADEPGKILLGIQDATELLDGQSRLRESQARYQALVETSAQIVWTTDASGAVVEDSPSWRAFTGQTLEQWQGFGWLDAIHAEDRARVRELWQRAVAEQTPVDTEYRVLHINSDWRWMKVRAVPVLNPDGRVREWVGMNSDITERKQAEESRRESEERFTKFMRHLPGLAWIKDSDGRYVYANDAAQEAFRTQRGELYGKSDEELFPPETAAQFRSNDRRALESESSVHTIETLEHADAVVHHSIVNKFAIPSATGKAALVGGIAIDITDLKQAEEELRDSEERYRTLFELGPVAVYTCDRAGVIQNFNRRAAELWGRKPAPGDTDPRFCGSFKMFRPDGSFMPHEQCPMAAVVAGILSEVRDGEVIIERPDGSRVTVIVNVLPLRDGRGEVAGAINCFYDITARKDAEEGRARLSAIVESSDDAIVSKGLDGIITSWNAGAERLFGYTAQEAVGQPVTMLIPPDRLDEETFILERVRQSEVVAPFDTVRRRKDGTLFDASVTVSPVRDSLGHVVGAAKIARDITERKRTEEALQQADRHKNEFLAMLAHELRNPLAPILVSIEIIRRAQSFEGLERLGDDSPKPDVQGGALRVDHAVDVLQRQTGQMVRLIDDLLDAGRISSGKIDLRREHVELSSVVHHAVDAARPLTERRDQELTVVLPPTSVNVDADPTRLAQIVGNLLNNASKFTEHAGHIWLTVEESMDSTPGEVEGASHQSVPQVVIRVRDTGVGIAADRLDSIFDMFTQVDRSLERSAVGLGIGLTLVKTLVEMHGGTIEATSPGIGHGSEFVVRLPIIVDAPAPSATPPLPQSVATPLRILVVDDNRDSADMLAILLKFSGHETHTAHDGMAAVEEAERLDPDVIVLDIGLPRLNGYEAARRIRERKGHNGRPLLVALTGWGQDEDRDRSKEAGFDAHLVKPVDEAALRRLLAGLVPDNQTVKP